MLKIKKKKHALDGISETASHSTDIGQLLTLLLTECIYAQTKIYPPHANMQTQVHFRDVRKKILYGEFHRQRLLLVQDGQKSALNKKQTNEKKKPPLPTLHHF